jgi:sporadic carbohydrate cluster 2OG-Fe(II) oxygenase
MSNFEIFKDQGYEVIDVENIEKIIAIEAIVKKIIAPELKIQVEEIELEKLYKLIKKEDVNKIRLKIIEKLNLNGNINVILIESVRNKIIQLIGKDILLQKNINMVIQNPNDPDPSEPHRDYPGNSAFETVVWIPLVNCEKTRSMYIVDLVNSLKITNKLKNNEYDSLMDYNNDIIKNSKLLDIRKGQALIFATPLFHGSHINNTDKTRVSFNLRVKNLFSPHGMKNPYSFWNIYNKSIVTEIALKFIK